MPFPRGSFLLWLIAVLLPAAPARPLPPLPSLQPPEHPTLLPAPGLGVGGFLLSDDLRRQNAVTRPAYPEDVWPHPLPFAPAPRCGLRPQTAPARAEKRLSGGSLTER